MYQHYLPTEYTSAFRGEMPRLAYTWLREGDDGEHLPPRILHRHTDTVELMLFTAGEAEYTVDDVRYLVKAGDIIVINAGMRHDEDARTAGQTHHMVGVGLQNIRIVGLEDDLLIPKDTNPIFTLNETDFALVAEMMRSMHSLSKDTARNTETCQMLACALVSLLIRIFGNTLRQEREMPGDRMLTTRIQDYIEAHYSEDIDLKSIGKALHISSYYLAHVFKESTGYPLMQYVIRLRMGKAQELLVNTSYSITRIAGMVGYDNASHFNTMFTKNIGISPGKYRKSFDASVSEKSWQISPEKPL